MKLDLEPDKIISSTRDYADAKTIINHIVREKFGDQAPYVYIGRKLNYRGHSSPIQAKQKYKRLFETNKDFRFKCSRCLI